MENLRVAFHNAARGRRDRPAVQRFALGVDRQLTDLAQQLRSGAIEVGRFRQFRIWDPKERVITAPCFQERVMHHALMNVCGPILDKWLIADTFACRSGLGREAALRRARQFSSNKTWFLKLDVRKYFDKRLRTVHG